MYGQQSSWAHDKWCKEGSGQNVHITVFTYGHSVLIVLGWQGQSILRVIVVFISVFSHHCCGLLSISYKDHVTNEKVCAKTQQAVGPHEDLLTTVKRRKLQWYGHVFCSSVLAKTILQGTVKGGRRQGRQKKRLEDNIRKQTGSEFAQSHGAVENREKWRKLILKSSVVPH